MGFSRARWRLLSRWGSRVWKALAIVGGPDGASMAGVVGVFFGLGGQGLEGPGYCGWPRWGHGGWYWHDGGGIIVLSLIGVVLNRLTRV